MFKDKKTISRKLMRKKVGFLLASVNLSFSLLLGMKKRKVYILLKKANKINKNLEFSKKELKMLALKLSLTEEKNFKQVEIIHKKFLKIDPKKPKISVEIFAFFIFLLPFFRKFFDLKQIIRV